MNQNKIVDDMAQLDETFIKILRDLNNDIISCSSKAVGDILQSSSRFLSDSAKKAITDFQKLYAKNSEMNAAKESVNREVDELFDAVQAEIAKGNDPLTANSVSENETEKQARLMLSGLQKQLETIIRLDEGIKDKLVPVLSSMQFEDMLRHRLGHLSDAWTLVVEQLKRGQGFDVDALGVAIAKMLTSQGERNAYYKIVLKKTPPEGLAEEQAWFDLAG